MTKLIDKLQAVLSAKKRANAYRSLKVVGAGFVDFCSNDYLGFAQNRVLQQRVHSALLSIEQLGATGSRLLSGNNTLAETLEKDLATFHGAEAALLFNSGYDANVGLYPTIARRDATIIYDEYVHASTIDGIRLSKAKSRAFAHNNLADAEAKLQEAEGLVFLSVESIYSMNGHIAPLQAMVELAEKYGAAVIVDEAHATGVVGQYGEGLVQYLQLEKRVFARVHTFGKALGVHGAVILGPDVLRQYLINFCRSFIFTTGPPFHTLIAIKEAYKMLLESSAERLHLAQLIQAFRQYILSIKSDKLQLIDSVSPIQGIIVKGNNEVRKLAHGLQQAGFDVRPIIPPTVPLGTERIRICLHAFNTFEEVERFAVVLKGLVG